MGRTKASSVNVALALPGVSLSGTWEPDRAERLASWELLVELSTRITAIDIADDEGSTREALESLYAVFDTTRKIMREHGPSLARSSGDGNLCFGVIAVRILNDVLRVPNADCPAQQAVVRVWRKPAAGAPLRPDAAS